MCVLKNTHANLVTCPDLRHWFKSKKAQSSELPALHAYIGISHVCKYAYGAISSVSDSRQ